MSTISAGTAPGTALVTSGDTTGQLVLQTNGTTTAVTIGTNQVVTLAQPLPVASGGTGSTTGLNLASAVTGTLPVANGGTGASSLTANNVLLGNGTSAVQVVAPGANGNVLTSNGTTWTSAAPAADNFTAVGTTCRYIANMPAMATATSALLTGGYVLGNDGMLAGTSRITVNEIPKYSTFYGGWVGSNSRDVFFSRNGLDWVLIDRAPSSATTINACTDGSTSFVVDDSNGTIFSFGIDGSGYLGFYTKNSWAASWSGVNYINTGSSPTLATVEFVWLGSSANSGMVVTHYNSTDTIVSTIAAGTTSVTQRASAANNNGGAASMAWNPTAGLVGVIRRAPATSQPVFHWVSGNINQSWNSVLRSTAGFDPGSNAQYRGVMSPQGTFTWVSSGASTVRYATSGNYNTTWLTTSVGGSGVLYYGHTGSSWYFASGTTGSTGVIDGFFVGTGSTPTGLSNSGVVPTLNNYGSSTQQFGTNIYTMRMV